MLGVFSSILSYPIHFFLTHLESSVDHNVPVLTLKISSEARFVMVAGGFQVYEKKVYGIRKNGAKDAQHEIGDIDVCYISEVTTNLRDLFPIPNRISNYLFVIKGRDRFFFEITAQSEDE